MINSCSIHRPPQAKRRFLRIALLSTYLCIAGVTGARGADPAAGPASAPATGPAAADPAEGFISLNLGDNTELKTLIDYVGQRLGINIIYQEDQVANQRVTLKFPEKIPASALRGLLESLLKSKGLALIEGDQPGWQRIVTLAAAAVPAGPSTRAAPEPTPKPAAAAANQVVAQVFSLEHVDAQRADQMVKTFLSGPTASSVAFPEPRLLLVTDYASNMDRIRRLMALLDQPNRSSRIEFLAVKHADATELAQQVKSILAAKARSQASSGQNAETIEVAQDKRTGQLVVIGSEALIREAQGVVKALDVPVNEGQSPIRFYKLANATAADVLDTLRALEGEEGGGSARPARRRGTGVGDPVAPNPNRTGSAASPLLGGAGATGAGTATGGTGGIIPNSNASRLGSTGPLNTGVATPAEGRGPDANFAPPAASGSATYAPGDDTSAAGASATSATAGPSGFRAKEATVAADPNTNTIIVIAAPPVQKAYESLIRALDKRRPQVMIECTIATLDTTHGYQLGVELSARSRGGSGNNNVITFSNFGLSTADPKTGQLALAPGVGFNGAVLSANVAQVLLHALDTDSHSKITSTPRILVNDNATGTLSSLAEFPYTSTNIGNNISTTSFGDYAKAGTQIVLTPHISESDYLQLDYAVSLSSFQGTANASSGIPPPLTSDSVQSRVTIPDGSTVVVGGLHRTNFVRTVNAIPLLGQIPLLKYLFSSRDVSDQDTTLFVFLRPVILRDDQFEDLKFLSESDLKAAALPTGWPTSEALPVH